MLKVDYIVNSVFNSRTYILSEDGSDKALYDPSCLCFEMDGMLFTGDAHIPGVKVFAGFPRSDKKQAIESEKRISEIIADGGLNVFAGHEI